MAAFPDYPFDSQAYIHSNGLTQHYLDEGPRNAAPVLMLHGNPTWSFYYRKLVLGLREKYRCIVPDHIGMGLSDKPDDKTYEFSLRQRIDDLDALIAHLIEKQDAPERGWTLVVHDWGGMIGFAWACRHPELISRLVILNTAAFPMPADKKLPYTLHLGRDTRLGALLIERFNAFAAGATRMAVRKPMSKEVRRAYVAPYDIPVHRLATLRFVQDIPLKAGDRGYDIVEATGKAITQFAKLPTLICWGMHDFVFDRTFLRTFREKFPQAEVHELPDAGHYVLEDASERIVFLARQFLAKHPVAV